MKAFRNKASVGLKLQASKHEQARSASATVRRESGPALWARGIAATASVRRARHRRGQTRDKRRTPRTTLGIESPLGTRDLAESEETMRRTSRRNNTWKLKKGISSDGFAQFNNHNCHSFSRVFCITNISKLTS